MPRLCMFVHYTHTWYKSDSSLKTIVKLHCVKNKTDLRVLTVRLMNEKCTFCSFPWFWIRSHLWRYEVHVISCRILVVTHVTRPPVPKLARNTKRPNIFPKTLYFQYFFGVFQIWIYGTAAEVLNSSYIMCGCCYCDQAATFPVNRIQQLWHWGCFKFQYLQCWNTFCLSRLAFMAHLGRLI